MAYWAQAPAEREQLVLFATKLDDAIGEDQAALQKALAAAGVDALIPVEGAATAASVVREDGSRPVLIIKRRRRGGGE